MEAVPCNSDGLILRPLNVGEDPLFTEDMAIDSVSDSEIAILNANYPGQPEDLNEEIRFVVAHDFFAEAHLLIEL
jgi:hypothetical protein